MEEQLSSNYSTRQQTTPILCHVCGQPSKGLVYGAIACQTCKTFFKRYAEQKSETLKCHFDGHCDININTRHTCAYCRLMKCFAVGMQKELLRASHPKTNRRKKKRKTTHDEVQIISTVSVRSAQIPSLNLPRTNQSTLTTEQWNLLSNLSHCYDDHAGFSIAENWMSQQNSLPARLRLKTPSILHLCQMILDAARSLYVKNQDFLSLCADDRTTLVNNTLMHTASISSNFICYKIRLMESPTFFDAVEVVTSAEIESLTRRFPARLNFDMIVMKLFLAILSFSTFRLTVFPHTSSANLSNIQEVLRIQDAYIELTWRYLLFKYDHQQAVKCFSDFIRCIFVLNDGIVVIQELQWFTNTIDSITRKTEHGLSVSE